MTVISRPRTGAYCQPNLRHKYALVLALIHEAPESTVCHCEYMWLGVFSCSASVRIHYVFCVYRQGTIGIDGYKEETRVRLETISLWLLKLDATPYVYQIGLIASVEVMNNGGFVEMRKLRHVVCSIEFGGIHFIDAVGFDFTLLIPGLAWNSQLGPTL